MRYQTHIVTSVAAGVAMVHLTPLESSIGLFVGIVAGSLLPDIDEPGSYVGRRTSVGVLNARIGLSSVIKSIFGHRGFTHSLLAALIVFMPYLLLAWNPSLIGNEMIATNIVSPLLLGLGLGYLFHILGDMFSKSGVPLFMPFTDNKIKIPLYVTGKMSEKIILSLSSVLLVFLVYKEFIQSMFV